jgi:hypothetical protein
MEPTERIVDRVINRWKQEGVSPRAPCPFAAVHAFERKEGLVLPEDFRTYWLSADGMPEALGQSQDSAGFSFWPLHRVARADVELKQRSPTTPLGPESASYYVFADYLDWSWAYAIKLRPMGIGHVVTVGTLSEHTVAQSFSEFLDAYLLDASTLYPPA